VNDTKNQTLPKANNLRQGELLLLTEHNQFEKEKSIRDQTFEQYNRTLFFFLKRNNLHLMHHLTKIFELKPAPQQNSSTIWEISGISLPNSEFTGSDEEQVAIGLGHVCHYVFMLSKYLDVPLRYELTPKCSRSIITDKITSRGQYPLYSYGVDRKRFEYAVFLLNKNIEQLLHSQGTELIKSLRDTLPNLSTLVSALEAHYQKLRY